MRTGDTFEMDFPFRFRTTKYAGGEEIPGKERWAVEYGPLLYGALGAPNPITVRFDPAKPEAWFTPARLRREGREVAALKLKGDDCHEYRAYADIDMEPFDVYPIVEK